MRSLRALPRGLATGRGRRQEALRRHRAAALIAAALIALLATAATADPHKPKPRPPKLDLLTGTEQGVLRRDAVEVKVVSGRGDRVRVEAQFVIDGYPDDYPFHLGPERERLRGGDARVRLRLSARQREVLDFAIKSCHGATLAFTAAVDGRKGRLQASLKQPTECRRA